MYTAKFENSNGKIFYFGYKYGNIFDIDGLTGLDVSVSMSQGFNQVGETVENLSIGSNMLEITGRLLGEATESKRKMLSVFAPFQSGRLTFENKYFVDCVVKKTPLITVETKDPKFELVLTAPYPYWQKVTLNSFAVGDYAPAFSFPVNYATPHIFGIKNPSAFINCVNGGEVEAYYKLEFRSKTTTVNPQIINVETQEFLKLNTTVTSDDKFTVYRLGGRLIVEKETSGVITDAFSVLDEDSDLMYMHVGNNLIKADADSGADQLITTITFNDAVVGVYEGI